VIHIIKIDYLSKTNANWQVYLARVNNSNCIKSIVELTRVNNHKH